jgi:hypothetical protein
MRPQMTPQLAGMIFEHTFISCLATDTKIERQIRAFQRCIMQENRSETRKVFQK